MPLHLLRNLLGRRRHARRADELQTQLMRTLELVVDQRQLQSAIMGYMVDVFRAGRGVLLVWNAEADRLQEVCRHGDGESAEAAVLAGGGHLVRWLQVNEEPLLPRERPDIVASLEPEERQLLERLGIEVCLPLVAMNRLVALVALGDLPSGPLSQLPANAMTQMGLALQNAVLYAQQQLRLRRLSRAERLATAGELAASAAHEIRNPLTAISSAVQLLGEAFPLGNPRRDVADNVMREIDRINEIVEGLLSFARPPKTKREAVRLRDVVAAAVNLVSTMAGKAKVQIRSQCKVERDVLQGDRDQLIQVFVNLLMNGIQAMPQGGELTIEVSRPGRLRVEIGDSGEGMTPEQLEKAFDPFYTTKEKGTGLGLPICYGIVRGHGGDIDLLSTPGKGTKVRVEL
ncbi:PAS domain-containing sensor histidine kinase [Candidatus Latescibacterota bacterium]